MIEAEHASELVSGGVRQRGSRPGHLGRVGQDGTQLYGKAYPSLRQLEVLKGLGPNAVVASVCPSRAVSTEIGNDPGYGYNPAAEAMLKRMRRSLTQRCAPTSLIYGASASNGRIPCTVIEAQASAGCACDAPGRQGVASAANEESARVALAIRGICDTPATPACSDYCLCEIEQFSGDDLETCQNSTEVPADLHGYCYVEPEAGWGSDEIVAACPEGERRLLRFVGDDVPAPSSLALIACGID